jgi:hypothetical protein
MVNRLRCPERARLLALAAAPRTAIADASHAFIDDRSKVVDRSLLHLDAGCNSVLGNVYTAMQGISGEGSRGAGTGHAGHSNRQ